MVAREHSEVHRQASWLELFFDLSFVIAVAQAAGELEHALIDGHLGSGFVSYFMVFAAIWWAWMTFTWFANVFDTDDVPYRLLMMVMIAGSLGLAAGVPRLAQLDFRIGVSAYVVMRLAYVAQWARALRSAAPIWRPVARRIIALTTINQAGWVLFLFVPLEWRVAVFIAWFAADVATPIVAGWDARMGGHRGHIVERYGLFTIIVLGESLVAATVAIGEAINGPIRAIPLLALAGGGLILTLEQRLFARAPRAASSRSVLPSGWPHSQRDDSRSARQTLPPVRDPGRSPDLKRKARSDMLASFRAL